MGIGKQPVDDRTVLLYAVGDVGPNRQDPESLFTPSRPVLQQADVLLGQLEIQLSERGVLQVDSGLDLAADSRNVSALTYAGFNVISFTANHGLDLGYDAFLDTIDVLKSNGIQVIGAGRDIAEARTPAIVELKGTRMAFLAYCSVAGPGREAGNGRPGIAPMRASTFYEQFDHQPGTPPRIITVPNSEDLEALKQDVKEARAQADIVVVSMHWGIHFVPAVIPMYEWEVGHAAVDAGADLVVGSHPHLLKGIEVYKNKVICHSLGNFAFDIPTEKAWSFLQGRIPSRKKLLPKYFQCDPAYPTFPFHNDSRKTAVVKCAISDRKIQRVSILPALINNAGQPEIVQHDREEFDDILNYLREVSEEEGLLDTTLHVDGDEAVIWASHVGSRV